jgi:hypothetical protein
MPNPDAFRYASVAAAAVLALPVFQCGGPLPAQTPEQVALPAAALPLSSGPPPPGAGLAPAAYAIPVGAPIEFAPPPWGPDTYGYVDAGYWLSNAVFDAPPDFAFGFGGVYPWAWVTAAGWTVIVEPVFGGHRCYYYRPGADFPFFVADPSVGFAFDTNGRLAVAYDSWGRAQPAAFAQRSAGVAGAFLARGQALQTASRTQSGRIAVSAGDWATRRGNLAQTVGRWSTGAAQTPDWGAWRARHALQDQAAFAGERYTREAEAARYARRAGDTRLASQHWSQALASRSLSRANRSQGVGLPGAFAGRGAQSAATAPAARQGAAPPLTANAPQANPQPPRRAYVSQPHSTAAPQAAGAPGAAAPHANAARQRAAAAPGVQNHAHPYRGYAAGSRTAGHGAAPAHGPRQPAFPTEPRAARNFGGAEAFHGRGQFAPPHFQSAPAFHPQGRPPAAQPHFSEPQFAHPQGQPHGGFQAPRGAAQPAMPQNKPKHGG